MSSRVETRSHERVSCGSVIPAITENNNTVDGIVNGGDNAITARCQLTAMLR
jgi:hypothetical protein